MSSEQYFNPGNSFPLKLEAEFPEIEQDIETGSFGSPVFGYVHSSLTHHSINNQHLEPEKKSTVSYHPLSKKLSNLVSRSQRSDSKLNEYLEVKNLSTIRGCKILTKDAHPREKDSLIQRPKNLRYIISENESLNSVALKFNMSPNMLKQMNGLSSDFIFPGQSLLVPQSQHSQSYTVPSVQNSLANTKTHFKYPMKRITRFDGSVSGTTLITSNAFMFRAHVSEKLVIQKGQNEYNMSIPLDSVSEIYLFESFEEMLANIQNTTGNDFACSKCAAIKQKLLHGTSESSDKDMEVSSEDECLSQGSGTVDPPKKLYGINSLNAHQDFSLHDCNTEGSSLAYSMSPVKSCEHEFLEFGPKYPPKIRINPFSIGDENNRIYIPNYHVLDTCPVGDDCIDPQIRRNESDTSLATRAFFQKIDENTNQMQNMLDSTYYNHEYSMFMSIHSIITSRTHGKPSYQQETDEGFRSAHFWICVPESEATKIIYNFADLCPHLANVDDMSHCVLRCELEHFKELKDAVLPDVKPKFLPREIATDLLSEPFSGNLNYPTDKTVLLTVGMMSELQPYLPCHVVGIDVLLAYSMKVHGMSLRSLYIHCEPYQDVPCLLLVKDTKGYVFGAYLSEGIIESPKYYGSGETFLFRLSPDPTQCYFWQGENHYFMMGTSDYFTVGAGDGNFALYLDEMLQKGTSNRSLTFYNDVLSASSSFNILTLEVWCFTDEVVEKDDPDSFSSNKLYGGGMVF